MNIRSLLILVCLCLPVLSADGQAKPWTEPTTPPVVRIERIMHPVYLADSSGTEKIMLAGNTLAQLLTGLVLDKKITAYSGRDKQFIEVKDVGELRNEIYPANDSIWSKIIGYGVIEECTYNRHEDKIRIRILGIAPIVGIYFTGTRVGVRALYWVKYDDVKEAIAGYTKQHKANNIYQAILRSHMNDASISVDPNEMQRAMPVSRTPTRYQGLSAMLLQAALADSIKAYDTSDVSLSSPLSQKEIATRLQVEPDTFKSVDAVTHESRQDIRAEIDYTKVTHYRMTEKMTYDDELNGAFTIRITSITPQRRYYGKKAGVADGRATVTFRYKDVIGIVNEYTDVYHVGTLTDKLFSHYCGEWHMLSGK